MCQKNLLFDSNDLWYLGPILKMDDLIFSQNTKMLLQQFVDSSGDNLKIIGCKQLRAIEKDGSNFLSTEPERD